MRLKSRSLLLLSIWLALPLVYAGWTVYAARDYTTTTILPQVARQHYPLALADLSPRQLEILLKVEDPDFYHHKGIDFQTPGAGITTITQALVKHLYFAKFTPGIAKIKQTLIARFALNPLMTKNEQLLLFINTVYFTPEIHGFAEAAQLYFAKPFSGLTEDEYTALVAMIIAPATFDIKRYPERNKERVERIKRLVSGAYVPKGLFDLFYGKLDKDAQKNLPPLSYFESYYRGKNK